MAAHKAKVTTGETKATKRPAERPAERPADVYLDGAPAPSIPTDASASSSSTKRYRTSLGRPLTHGQETIDKTLTPIAGVYANLRIHTGDRGQEVESSFPSTLLRRPRSQLVPEDLSGSPLTLGADPPGSGTRAPYPPTLSTSKTTVSPPPRPRDAPSARTSAQSSSVQPCPLVQTPELAPVSIVTYAQAVPQTKRDIEQAALAGQIQLLDAHKGMDRVAPQVPGRHAPCAPRGVPRIAPATDYAARRAALAERDRLATERHNEALSRLPSPVDDTPPRRICVPMPLRTVHVHGLEEEAPTTPMTPTTGPEVPRPDRKTSVQRRSATIQRLHAESVAAVVGFRSLVLTVRCLSATEIQGTARRRLYQAVDMDGRLYQAVDMDGRLAELVEFTDRATGEFAREALDTGRCYQLSHVLYTQRPVESDPFAMAVPRTTTRRLAALAALDGQAVATTARPPPVPPLMGTGAVMEASAATMAPVAAAVPAATRAPAAAAATKAPVRIADSGRPDGQGTQPPKPKTREVRESQETPEALCVQKLPRSATAKSINLTNALVDACDDPDVQALLPRDDLRFTSLAHLASVSPLVRAKTRWPVNVVGLVCAMIDNVAVTVRRGGRGASEVSGLDDPETSEPCLLIVDEARATWTVKLTKAFRDSSASWPPGTLDGLEVGQPIVLCGAQLGSWLDRVDLRAVAGRTRIHTWRSWPSMAGDIPRVTELLAWFAQWLAATRFDQLIGVRGPHSHTTTMARFLWQEKLESSAERLAGLDRPHVNDLLAKDVPGMPAVQLGTLVGVDAQAQCQLTAAMPGQGPADLVHWTVADVLGLEVKGTKASANGAAGTAGEAALWYNTCPRIDTACFTSATGPNAQGRFGCTRCGHDYGVPRLRYALSVIAADHTGRLVLRAFGGVARQLMHGFTERECETMQEGGEQGTEQFLRVVHASAALGPCLMAIRSTRAQGPQLGGRGVASTTRAIEVQHTLWGLWPLVIGEASRVRAALLAHSAEHVRRYCPPEPRATKLDPALFAPDQWSA